MNLFLTRSLYYIQYCSLQNKKTEEIKKKIFFGIMYWKTVQSSEAQSV